MSILARPSVVFAIVFGCFAVLLPRIFIPLFRSKPATPAHNFDDRECSLAVKVTDNPAGAFRLPATTRSDASG